MDSEGYVGYACEVRGGCRLGEGGGGEKEGEGEEAGEVATQMKAWIESIQNGEEGDNAWSVPV